MDTPTQAPATPARAVALCCGTCGALLPVERLRHCAAFDGPICGTCDDAIRAAVEPPRYWANARSGYATTAHPWTPDGAHWQLIDTDTGERTAALTRDQARALATHGNLSRPRAPQLTPRPPYAEAVCLDATVRPREVRP
jgi:hypothetical protein